MYGVQTLALRAGILEGREGMGCSGGPEGNGLGTPNREPQAYSRNVIGVHLPGSGFAKDRSSIPSSDVAWSWGVEFVFGRIFSRHGVRA